MATPDLYSLFSGAPDAAQQASAMAAALRRQQAVGQLGMLTGDKVLAPFGQSLVGGAEQGQGQLAQAGAGEASRGLQRALQASQQGFSAEQGGLERDARAGENALERAARAREGGLNRALEARLAGMRTEAEKAKAQADASAKGIKTEGDLRAEFLKLPATVKAEQVTTAWRQLKTAAPTGVGDLQRIFAFTNMIDPGVAVRQEDVINLGKTGGLPGQAQAYFNQLTATGTLSDSVRRQMEESGRSVAAARLKSYGDLQNTYRGLATQYGVDPSRSVPDLGLGLDDAPAGPIPAAAPGVGNQAPATAGPDGGVVGPRDPRNIVKKETTADGTYYYYADGTIEVEE